MKRKAEYIDKICPVCGEVFTIPARYMNTKQRRGIVCSRKCARHNGGIATAGLDKHGINNPNWKGGVSDNNYHYKKLQVERYPERIRAREAALYAIKSGSLQKQPCIVCGEEDVQAHHSDYSQPLEITWLCRKHHRQLHDKERIKLVTE